MYVCGLLMLASLHRKDEILTYKFSSSYNMIASCEHHPYFTLTLLLYIQYTREQKGSG
jgi:hypothetical protein